MVNFLFEMIREFEYFFNYFMVLTLVLIIKQSIILYHINMPKKPKGNRDINQDE